MRIRMNDDRTTDVADDLRPTLHTVVALALRPVRRWWFGPPDVEEAARGILRRATIFAFRTFRDERFRRAMAFADLPEREHDFIFNELTATSVALPMLMVESIASFTNPGPGRDFYRDLRAALDAGWEAIFAGYGIPSEQLRDWRKLITLRLREFEETRIGHRDKFVELGEGNPWTAVCAVTCLYHIRHGKRVESTEGSDPAFPLLVRLFGTCAISTMKVLKRHTFRI